MCSDDRADDRILTESSVEDEVKVLASAARRGANITPGFSPATVLWGLGPRLDQLLREAESTLVLRKDFALLWDRLIDVLVTPLLQTPALSEGMSFILHNLLDVISRSPELFEKFKRLCSLHFIPSAQQALMHDFGTPGGFSAGIKRLRQDEDARAIFHRSVLYLLALNDGVDSFAGY